MKNKLKLGQAAGVVAFAIIIGAVSMSSSSTVDARTTKAEANKNRSVNAGVALNLTDVADATELLTAGVTSALTYYPRHRQPHRPVVTQILVCQLSAAET